MIAKISPLFDDGRYLVCPSFEVEPGELEDVPEELVHRAAQWAAGMARSMWLQTASDLEAMASMDAASMPDTPAGLVDGEA